MHLLDFEKPIVELEKKLDEMRALDASDESIDLTEQVNALAERVEMLRAEVYRDLTRWQRVQIARHPERPYTLDYLGFLTRNFLELHGDRAFADDPAIVAGPAQFRGARYGYRNRTVFFIGQQKGRDTKNRKLRRFGMPNPEGYRKARRLMQMAARFNKPIVCLLDTPGAYPGLEAEERGQAEAIARNLFEMARFPVPIVVVVIGEGASGGALGIGVGDKVLMLENTWYSVISPESCSSILWRSWDYKEQAARALKLTAQDMIQTPMIDGVIPEPLGGAHRNPKETAANVGQAIADALSELDALSGDELVDRRLAKFDRMGEWVVRS
ncbi:MAG: acetyl-CoA carboxylase carboxyltransferase subunit alpha [Bacteroidota bacterium]